MSGSSPKTVSPGSLPGNSHRHPTPHKCLSHPGNPHPHIQPASSRSINMHLLSTYFVPGPVLDAKEITGVKVDRILSFMELTFELGKQAKYI